MELRDEHRLSCKSSKGALLLILSSIVISFNIYGQLNNSAFYLPPNYHTEKKHDLYFDLNILGFTKNNEYFNKISDGYTLFGYQLNPDILFFPSENVMLRAGLFTWKDFGNNGYSRVSPTFTVDIEWKSFHFLFGTLNGAMQHRLIEPIYDFERVMTDRLENGIQAVFNRGRFFVDFWIDWENMLYKGDPEQEKLSGGFVTKFRIVDKERYKLEIPFQIFGMHRGGQIDASPLPIKTAFNTAIGLSGECLFPGNAFFHGIRTDDYLVLYDDLSFEKLDVYNEGYGVYLNLMLKTRLFDFMISYWNGHHYISGYGGTLYNSRSTTFKHPDYIEPNRELLIFRLLQDIQIIDNLYITVRFEPFYDFHKTRFEFSHGLYVNYRHTFFLKKVKTEP